MRLRAPSISATACARPSAVIAAACRWCATDDLAALPLRAVAGAASAAGSRGDRRSDPGLRQPGRRRQPQRRAHGRVAGGPAGFGAGRDRQSPVRLRAGSRRPGRARDRARRGGAGARRRRRRHVARAVRHGQGRCAVRARAETRRHHAGLALRQSGDARSARRGFDDADRGKPRARTGHRPRGPGRLRPALAAARGACDRRRPIRRGTDARGHVRRRRTAAQRHHAAKSSPRSRRCSARRAP